MRELTQAHRGLLDQLGEIVQNEVITPMNQVGWNEGQQALAELHGLPVTPDAAPQGSQPPPNSGPPNVESKTAPASPEATATDLSAYLESLRDEKTGLILRKYKDVPAAIKGVQHAVSMAHEAFDQRDAAFAKLAELEATALTASPTPKAPVAPTVDTAALDAALAKILEEGGMITPDTVGELREAIVKTAASVVPQSMADPDQPLWDEAFAKMEQEIPGFGGQDNLDAIGLHLRMNPVTKAGVDALVSQKKFYEASRLAYNSMALAAPAPLSAEERRSIELTAKGEVRQAAVDAARKDAGVLTTTAGGTHEVPPSGPTQAEIDAAAAIFARTTDGREWRRLAFGSQLNSPLFD